MATKYSIKETSYRIGCGRYLQGSGIISSVAEEVIRLGCRKPFVMGGKTALSLTRDAIEQSLSERSLTANFYTYLGFCCQDVCSDIMASEEFKECDAVVGVGGLGMGHIRGIKLNSDIALRLICIPRKRAWSRYT